MKLKTLTIINLLLITIPLMALLVFAWMIPTSNPAIIKKADAIVVLTGSSGRIQAGIDLLETGAAGKMFISGVWKGAKLKEVLKGTTIKEPETLEKITLGYDATSTKENAAEVKNWIKENNYTSIYLVTANYHLPRAKLLLAREVPEIRIITYPAFPENFKEGKIFSDTKTAKLFFSEFLKYIVTLLKFEY